MNGRELKTLDVSTGDPRLDELYRLAYFLGMAQVKTVELLEKTEPKSFGAVRLEIVKKDVEAGAYGVAHTLGNLHAEGAYAWREQPTEERAEHGD